MVRRRGAGASYRRHQMKQHPHHGEHPHGEPCGCSSCGWKGNKKQLKELHGYPVCPKCDSWNLISLNYSGVVLPGNFHL